MDDFVDTIRVRIQTQTGPKLGLHKHMTHLYTHEGWRGFFKGIWPPIVSNAPINAVVFAAFGETSRWMLKTSGKKELTVSQQFLAGGGAGLLQTVFASTTSPSTPLCSIVVKVSPMAWVKS